VREKGSPAVVQELGELGKLMSLNGKSVAQSGKRTAASTRRPEGIADGSASR